MPTINGKRVLANSPEALSQTNALGGINKVSNKEASGSVTPGTTGTGVSQIQPSISANELINPPTKVNPPVPTLNTNTGANTANLVNNVATNNQQLIASQSAGALKAKELANLLGTQTFDAAGQRTQLNEQYGLPANLSRLTDIQTQLTKANTASDVQKTQIEGAAGQTMGQAQREVTQQDRENAVRTAGLAAEAAVLQGSIETASTLINSAMTDYYADRQANNKNMIDQLNYFSGIADKETAQLLQKEQRSYEEDQANIKDVKDSVSMALETGSATGEQIRLLTDPKASDIDRMKVAQEIIASSSAEDRGLKLQQIRQSLAASSLSAKKNRLELCQSGDNSYCSEFNIDPNALTQAQIDERVNNQNQSIGLQLNMERLQGVINNDLGLQLSSGSLQSPFISGALGGPLAGTQQGTAGDLLGFTPVVGNIMNYNRAKQAKEQFLGDVEYLLSNRVFEKVAEIKADGYAGAISNTELELMANASSVLSSLAIKDGDTIIGFRGGEGNLKKELGLYMDIYKRANDALNIKALQPSTQNDIISAYNE